MNDNNRKLNITIGATTTPITLEVGSYTFSELGNHLQTKLNTTLSPSVFTVVSNGTTYKYNITIIITIHTFI